MASDIKGNCVAMATTGHNVPKSNLRNPRRTKLSVTFRFNNSTSPLKCKTKADADVEFINFAAGGSNE